MRRWSRILVVGGLTVILAIDSASACRFLRSRCRPRCRVVASRVVRRVESRCVSACVTTCAPCGSIEIGEPGSWQCCVPADGSAHAVITEPVAATAPDTPTPAEPQRLAPLVPPLEPVAPASAEKPLVVPPAAPVPQPEFKTAAEILAESAERDRLEKAALEATKPPAPQPQFKSAAEILAESAEQERLDKPAAPAELPMRDKQAPAEPAGPSEPPAPAEAPAPRKPAPKPAEENLFDEPADEPAAEDRATMKKEPPVRRRDDDLFGEPEGQKPENEPAPAAQQPAADEPVEERNEKAEDDPFAAVDAAEEPVRRWIDSTGRHETIGRLVEVRPDSVRILKSNGRHTTVSFERLSRHDRAYVAAVSERLAARRPAVTDTAQR